MIFGWIKKKFHKQSTQVEDLPRASGTCQSCGVTNSMVYIPKHRNGNQGKYCCRCNNIDFSGDEKLLPPSYHLGDEDFKGGGDVF